MKKYQDKLDFIVKFFYFAVVVLLVYLPLRYLFPLVLPFIIGGFAAMCSHKLAGKMSCKHKKICDVLVLSAIYALVSLSAYFICRELLSQLSGLGATLPGWFEKNIIPLIEKLSLGKNADEVLLSGLSGFSQTVINFARSAASFLPDAFFCVFAAVFSSYLIVVDYDRIRNFILRNLPRKIADRTITVVCVLKKTVVCVGRAYALLFLLTAGELSLGLYILGVENAVAVAVLIAFADLMPILGTGTVLVPWILISLAGHDFSFAIGLSVTFLIITVIRNIAEPRLIAKGLDLHPLVTLAAMFTGIRLFGFFGIVIAPLFVIIIKKLNETKQINLYE